MVILLLLLFGKIIIKPEYVSFGDNTFLFKKLFISAWLPYENNGVSAVSLISTYTRDVLFTKAFLVTGMKFEIISKLSYLLPIFLSLLIFFLLLRKISDSFLYALIGSILFILSVTSIEHMTVSFVLYFFHVSSLLILTYFIFRWGFDWEKIRYKGILALVFLSFLNLHPFYFIIYNLYLLFYLLYITWKGFKYSNIAKFGFIFTSIIVINSIWLLPFLLGVFAGRMTPGNLYGDSNFNAVLSGFINHSSIFRIVIGSIYPISEIWDNLVNNWLVFSYYALFALSVYFIFNSFRTKNKTTSFLSTVFLFFLSLSFWPNNPVLGGIWDFLLGNYSFFGFFRSFNRFITVLLPTMLVITGINYKEFPKKRVLNTAFVLILLLILFGRRDLMTGDLGGIVPMYKIPNEYTFLNEELKSFKNNEKETPRVVTYPKTDYEMFIWMKPRNYEKISSVNNFLNNYTDAEILMSKYGNHVFISQDFFKNIFDYKYCLEKENYIKDLNKIDIDYVLLNKDLINRKGDIIPFENYRGCLENHNFSLLMDNEYFDLYKVNYGEEYKKDYTITEVYPFYYIVNFDFKGQENFELKFPQNFNSGWKLYFDDSKDSGFIEKNAIPFYNKEIQVQHFDNEPGNKWVLNRNDFNDDNVTLHLYYYPQIYVVIGSVISLFSIIIVVTTGIGIEIKNIKKKKLINVQ